MNLTSPSVIKEILKKYNFKFSKSLGQNFICSSHICTKMAKENQNQAVLEVGSGIGTLTLELAKVCKKVVSIELDKRLIPILNENLINFKNVKIINDDILKINLKKLIETEFQEFEKISVCANLPYYITSPIIMKILESDLPIDSLILMVQKEAAERICAKPATREVGALSIAVRYYCEPEILFNVNKSSFMPQPNVDSAVIKLKTKKSSSDSETRKSFFRLIKILFLNRRKTILNTLSSGLHLHKEKVSNILNALNLDNKLRPEQLTFQNFLNLALAFSAQKNL